MNQQGRRHIAPGLEEQRAYWMKHLGGSIPALRVPLDHSRPPVPSFFRGRRSVRIEETSYVELGSFCAQENLSLFVVLLGTLQVLLSRYSAQDDICIGTVSMDSVRQSSSEWEEQFTNLVALHTRLSGDSTAREFLQVVTHMVAEATRNRDFPFDELAELIGKDQVRGRLPIFQTMMIVCEVLPTVALRSISLEGLSNVEEYMAQCDLVFIACPEDRGLRLECDYDADLFATNTIQRLLEHFCILQANIIANPSLALSRLPILSASERHKLVVEWNGTHKHYSQDQCIHHLFEQQCKKTPDATAIIFENESIAYKELNSRANQLAHYLQDLGVASETLVGINMQRSVDMVVGLLAILKAGAAYVPLDPALPRERLAFMLADTQAPVLLTIQELDDHLPRTNARVVSIKNERQSIASQSKRNLNTHVIGDNLAYVIYTSGSTGEPKGVQIQHQSVTNLLLAVRDELGLTKEDVLLAVTILSFDIAVLELFLPLIVGARLVIAQEGDVSDGKRLLEYMYRNCVSMMQATPATWHLLLEADWCVPSQVKALCGGETLTRDLANELLARTTCLWNMYGPTETTIWSTTYPVTLGDGPVPIGRPIANTRSYVLDQYLEPVPIGVAGNLYIGGLGISRGYLNRPTLTAESFIPDPFSDEPGARLYKTGDLARYLPDGNLEFLSRQDQQVKIRGHRVELGEVESQLGQHSSVKKVVVQAREDTPGGKILVAYIVPEHESGFSVTELRAFLKTRLPQAMIPSAFLMMEVLPLTANKKVDWQALPSPGTERPTLDAAYAPPASSLEKTIARIWHDVLHIDEVGIHDNFFDLGGHSLLLAKVRSDLARICRTDLSMTDLFRYPTIDALAQCLTQRSQEPLKSPDSVSPLAADDSIGSEVAIIGMAGRFPGAKDLGAFWENLCEGEESVSFFTDQELLAAGVDPMLLNDRNYVKAGAILEDYDHFDASFFGMSPKEAEITDPQHRLFLETAWEALENAGYDPSRYSGRIGVYAGASMNTYLLVNLAPNQESMATANHLALMIGNDKDFLTTRTSYKMNLKGPSVTVQTACSTSLVAVHIACRSLLDGECDMALAGGVSVRVPQIAGYHHEQGDIYSPDGHCRAFDACAQGTVFGSGVGIVILKRLAAALRDRDHIYAIIRGSAVNNDGASKVGYTAPSVERQAEVVRMAHKAAGTPSETITYVEAHGTATALGDPVEIAALTQAFCTETQKRSFCAIGSVKTNIGHLDAAAGVAGLIKTALALHHRSLPPSLHFEKPNPRIDFSNSPFFVNTTLRTWSAREVPRRAGVSSLGIGGTNAHVILEEAPTWQSSGQSRPWQLLMLSAQTDTALETTIENLIAYLRSDPNAVLPDIAYTLNIGRRTFNHRCILVCSDLDDAVSSLQARSDSDRVSTSYQKATTRPVVFMFPGQGSQYTGMASELYEVEPEFRAQLDVCAEMLQPGLEVDIRNILFAGKTRPVADSQSVNQTATAQPVLFAVEYALARLLMSWGVQPTAMIGHSFGEYVAACLSGVLSLEDALAIVAIRARLMQGLPSGAMLAVHLPELQLGPILDKHPTIDLAAINTPFLCVVSGPVEAVDNLEKKLARQGVGCQRLGVSHAFHSSMMDSILDAFAHHMSEVPLAPPRIPYVSNVTGTWISLEEATDPSYWSRQLRETVRFTQGLQGLMRDPEIILLEIGPGRTLTNIARHHVDGNSSRVILNSLRHVREKTSDVAFLLNTMGQLWQAGAYINLTAFYAQERRIRIPLPTYPFERKSYWIEPKKPREALEEVQIPSFSTQVRQPTVNKDLHPRPSLNNPFLAPRNKTEEQIAAMWQNSLGILDVGIEDNFFELGGDSLVAVGLVSRMREQFEQEFPLATFFERPTIKELAAILKARKEDLSDV